MPLSTANKTPLQEHQRRDNHNNHKKRKHSDSQLSPTSHTSGKKLKEDTTSNMTDTQQKKANFSALTSPSNGFNRNASPLANSKPGSAKKLVIKNFKGEHPSPGNTLALHSELHRIHTMSLTTQSIPDRMYLSMRRRFPCSVSCLFWVGLDYFG